MSNDVKFSLGTYFHGTKADLKIGDFLQPGFLSNYEEGRVAKYVYFTGTLDAGSITSNARQSERIRKIWN